MKIGSFRGSCFESYSVPMTEPRCLVECGIEAEGSATVAGPRTELYKSYFYIDVWMFATCLLLSLRDLFLP